MKKYYIYTYFRIGHSWVNLQLRVEVRGTCTATCQATWLVEVPAGDLWAAAPNLSLSMSLNLHTSVPWLDDENLLGIVRAQIIRFRHKTSV